jgi:hypothetical protein
MADSISLKHENNSDIARWQERGIPNQHSVILGRPITRPSREFIELLSHPTLARRASEGH